MYRSSRGGHTLADSLVIILEETVEDAVGRSGRDPYVYQAHKFRRLDVKVSGLLGNDHPAAEEGCIVYLVII